MSYPDVAVVLLGAGYGTRLYPLTKDTPKALLPIGERLLLDEIFEAVLQVPQRSTVTLVSNHVFAEQFRAWLKPQAVAVEVIDNGTQTPETRLGAIRDLWLALERVSPDDDALVLGTDNLFTWSLAEFVESARRHRPAASIAVYDVASKVEASRCAVVEMARDHRLTSCVEKPKDPKSLTVGLCVYFFPAPIRKQIETFIRSGGNIDAPGYFMEWLVAHEPVYGFPTHGEWFDIGSPEAYQEAVQRWAVVRPGRR